MARLLRSCSASIRTPTIDDAAAREEPVRAVRRKTASFARTER